MALQEALNAAETFQDSNSVNMGEALKTGVQVAQGFQQVELNKTLLEQKQFDLDQTKQETLFKLIKGASDAPDPVMRKAFLSRAQMAQNVLGKNSPLYNIDTVAAVTASDDMKAKLNEAYAAMPSDVKLLPAFYARMNGIMNKPIEQVEPELKALATEFASLQGKQIGFNNSVSMLSAKDWDTESKALATDPGVQKYTKPEVQKILTTTAPEYIAGTANPQKAALYQQALQSAYQAKARYALENNTFKQNAQTARITESVTKGNTTAVSRISTLTKASTDLLQRMDVDIKSIFDSGKPVTKTGVLEGTVALIRAIKGSASITKSEEDRTFFEGYGAQLQDFANKVQGIQTENIGEEQKNLLRSSLVTTGTEFARAYQAQHERAVGDYTTTGRFSPQTATGLRNNRDKFIGQLSTIAPPEVVEQNIQNKTITAPKDMNAPIVLDGQQFTLNQIQAGIAFSQKQVVAAQTGGDQVKIKAAQSELARRKALLARAAQKVGK